MRRKLLTIVIFALPVAGARPSAGSGPGEICAVRPDLCDAPARPNVRARGRRPASAAPSGMTFESYLQANAANPALLRHGIEQSAFKETRPAAVLVLPNIDGSADAGAAAAASTPSTTSTTPTGGAGGSSATPAPAGGTSPPVPGAGAR